MKILTQYKVDNVHLNDGRVIFVQVREDNVWMQSTGVINAKEMDLLFKVIIRVIVMGLL